MFSDLLPIVGTLRSSKNEIWLAYSAPRPI